MNPKINVGVFFGGRSVEHEVSIISAMQAIAAMDRAKYNPIAIYMTKDGQMLTGEGFDVIDSYKNLAALRKRGQNVAFLRDGKQVLMLSRNGKVLGTLDVALPVAHGTHSEDGAMAGFFDLLNLPYGGCDVYSSAVCMDKSKMKHLLAAAGINVLPHLTFSGARIAVDGESIVQECEAKFGFPVIVKPNNLGSSVGITIAHDAQKLRTALEYAARYAELILVERAVQSIREINCAVLGDMNHAMASACEQPMGSDEILSFQDKYLSGGGKQKGGSKHAGMAQASREIPANIPAAQTALIKQTAVDAFKVLGCSGVARVDFIIDDADGQIYVNEFNTIPGSLAFYLFEAEGLSFTELVTRLIQLAFKRERANNALYHTFESNILENANLNSGKK